MDIKNLKNNLNDFLDKKSDELKQLKDKALDKMEEQAENLDELKDKILDKIEIEAEELKDKAGKTIEKIKLENIIPDIQQIILKKTAPLLRNENLKNLAADQLVKTVFKTTYTFLPAPVRLIVDEETFVHFCQKNKGKILKPKTQEVIGTADEKQEMKDALKALLDAGIISKSEYDEKLAVIN
jgi:hypothetical protein